MLTPSLDLITTALQAAYLEDVKPPVFFISYKENLEEQDLLQEISQITDPQVFLWYIGSHGLKEQSVHFYKNKIRHIVEKQGTCQLLDLTAWGAFFNKNAKISASNRCAKQINDFQLERIKCISASTLFQEMQKVRDQETVKLFNKQITQKPWLQKVSDSFKTTSIKVGDIFQRNCPILDSLYEDDTGKSYSIIQYVEGLFLIQEIIKEKIHTNQKINIVFALPNDESKYYRDDQNSFVHDLEAFLVKKWGPKLNNKEIHIQFLNFKYGEAALDRPYNAGKKVLKKLDEQSLF